MIKKAKNFITVIIFSLLIPISPALVFAWGNIEGFVRDFGGQPISGAIIVSESGTTAVSSEDGSYNMIHIAGTFQFTASTEGYTSETKTVLVTDDMIVYCDFALPILPIIIENVTPNWEEMGSDLDVTIYGSGFDEYTRVSMSLDAGNSMKILGSIVTPGYAFGVTVIGNTAYVADREGGLQVVDTSDQKNPIIIGSYDTSGHSYDVTVINKIAYVADGSTGGLQLIDVSNPETPIFIAAAPTTGDARGVAVANKLAYVADYYEGLQIIDIDPESPSYLTLIGSYPVPSLAHAVTVVSNTAYVADTSGALLVIDVSEPTEPVINGNGPVLTPGGCYGVTVVDGKAYVADDTSGLQIIDVDPESPSYLDIIGSVDTPGYALEVVVVEGKAYVADDSSGGLQIIDVNPESPSYLSIIGSIDTPGTAWGVAVIGITAYVADRENGLQLIDISKPAVPNIMGFVDTPGESFAIEIVDNKAYMADGYTGGLQVIDVTNLSSPTEIGSFDTLGSARDISVVGTRAYVADHSGGLQVIDISNPTLPSLTASFSTPGNAYEIDVLDNKAYVACGSGGLQVIDISNPVYPASIGSYATSGDAVGLTVIGSTAYVACGTTGGLQIIDISNPAAPILTGNIDTPGDAYSVTIAGKTAYVADGDRGLQVIDVTNPANPNIIGSVDTPDSARKVIVIGSTAYVTDHSSGLQAIDVSEPEKPTIVGSVDTPGFARGVAIMGSTAYVADGSRGLSIVPVPVEITLGTIMDDTQIDAILPSPQISGNYTIRVFNSNQNYELPGAVTFTNQLQTSKAIIVAGGGSEESNWLWDETKRCANYAYRALLYQGYRKENIYYISSENVDVDGNGLLDDVDDDATNSNLSDAINTWANTGSPADDLVLYMVDHGGDAIFRMGQEETLDVEDLDSWLDDFQATLPGKLIFVYDACQSGTFIPPMVPVPPIGNENDRIVITSASNEEALFYRDGRISFSWQFWASIFEGASLSDAFNFGYTMMKDYQTACLDANGDGIENTKQDLIPGIKIGRGYVPASDIPYITEISPDQTLHGGGGATLWASGIVDASGVSEVWATIIRPDHNPERPDIPITDLPTVNLTYSSENHRYEGTYTEFDILGAYTVSFYAMDNDGMISLPKSSTVSQRDAPDIYEEDNSYNQANVIVLNSETVEHRNFHAEGDEDWVKFYGIAGTDTPNKYNVKASNLGINCDIIIELYDTDGTTLLADQDTIGDPHADELLEWECLKDGVYYVRIINYPSTAHGEGTEYDLKAYRAEGGLPGHLFGNVFNELGEGVGDALIKSELTNSTTMSLDSGFYMMILPSGTHMITVKSGSYATQNQNDVAIEANNTTIQNFIMTAPSIVGDTDGDDDVDGSDLVDIAEYFDIELGRDDCTDQNSCECDLNNDGSVNEVDIEAFAETFGL